MKTLRKFFIMFAIVLFASLAAKTMIIAEEGTTEPNLEIIKEDANIKDGELTIDETTKEPDIKEEIEVFVDTDEGADVVIQEGEQGYTEIPEQTPGHPTNIIGEYTDVDVVDPADIDVTIDPELGQEVENVSAEKSISELITDWVWDNPISGHFEEKQIEKKSDIRVIDNEDGTWTVETPEIQYVLHHDLKGYYFKKPIYKDETEVIGDYEKIYIHIETQDMQIDPNIIGDDAGLNLIKKDIDISVDLSDPNNPVSDVVTIFDVDNVDMFVKDYDEAYDDPNEGLTFSNYKARIYDADGELVDDSTVIVGFDENTGEITLSSKKTGEFTVYLEGWYTQSQYRHIDSDISYRYDKLGDIEYESYIFGKYKYTYENNVFGIVGLTKNTYKLQDNSGWATFAELNLKVVEAVAEKVVINEEVSSLTEKEKNEIIEKVKEEYGIDITEEDIENVDKWIVASEADKTESETQQGIDDIKENFGITTDDEKFSWFNIDLFRQVTINNGGDETKLPAEQIKSLTEAQTIILEVSQDKVQLEPGKDPDFKVYYKHIDEEGNEIFGTINGVQWTLEDGVYNIKFQAKDFSLYGVTYELVEHHNHHNRPHDFVMTGVENTNPVKHNNIFTLIVMCAFATLLAIKKEH